MSQTQNTVSRWKLLQITQGTVRQDNILLSRCDCRICSKLKSLDQDIELDVPEVSNTFRILLKCPLRLHEGYKSPVEDQRHYRPHKYLAIARNQISRSAQQQATGLSPLGSCCFISIDTIMAKKDPQLESTKAKMNDKVSVPIFHVPI